MEVGATQGGKGGGGGHLRETLEVLGHLAEGEGDEEHVSS
jgi:hypothetical protein